MKVLVVVEDDTDMRLLIELTLRVDDRLDISGGCATAAEAIAEAHGEVSYRALQIRMRGSRHATEIGKRRGEKMRTPEWITARGEHIALQNMTDEHIRNVRGYLAIGDGVHGPMLRQGCSGFSNAEWLRLCACELLRRRRYR